jgi:type II secretory pathway component PulM
MGKSMKRWEDLPPEQRKAIVAVGVVTSLLQLVMLWDLWRRPAEQIRGSKRAWVIASFVRPFGQIAYVLWGRRP